HRGAADRQLDRHGGARRLFRSRPRVISANVAPPTGEFRMNAPVHVDPAEDAYALPLDAIDVSNPKLYQNDVWYPYFERLRREDPVHYTKDGMYGSYWSVTKYKDIMSVEVDHHTYSSEAMLGGISITDRPVEYRRASFISMDPPKHDEQRRVVSPIVAPM